MPVVPKAVKGSMYIVWCSLCLRRKDPEEGWRRNRTWTFGTYFTIFLKSYVIRVRVGMYSCIWAYPVLVCPPGTMVHSKTIWPMCYHCSFHHGLFSSWPCSKQIWLHTFLYDTHPLWWIEIRPHQTYCMYSIPGSCRPHHAKHEYIWCTSISNTCAQSGVLCLQRCMLWGVRRMPAIEPILETTMLIEVVSRHWANEQQSFVVGHCTIESGLLLRGTSCIHRAFQWHWGKMVVHRPANFKPSQLEIQVTSISRFSP